MGIQLIRALVLAATLMAAGAASAATLTVGQEDGSGGNCLPFGCNTGDYQQVYAASDFSGPVDITAISFGRTDALGHVDVASSASNTIASGTYTFSLSTTGKPVNGLDSTQSNNLGSDNRVFFTGALSGTPTTLTVSGPGFQYNPAAGNLLLTIQTPNKLGGGIFFNAMNGDSNGLFSRAPAFGGPNYGLVTSFTVGGAASSSSSVNFAFPLQGSASTYVETMAGGLSADQTAGTFCGVTVSSPTPIDPCHTRNQANYAVDFVQDPGKTNMIVAAGGGTVVQAGAVSDGAGHYYAKIVIDNGPEAGSSGHYFTIYQEFSGYTSQGAAQAAATAFVSAGVQVTEGQQIASLTGGIGHLHFQVGYGCSGPGYTGCSSISNQAQLSKVEIGGTPLTSFTLANVGTCQVLSASTVSAGCDPTEGRVGSSLNPVGAQEAIGQSAVFATTAGNLGLGVDDFMYFDPAHATAYDFALLSGPAFQGLLLPGQADPYGLWLYDAGSGTYLFSTDVTGGAAFLFGPGGVDQFRITGIEGAGDFLVGLEFASAGPVTFTQTPSFAAVPEPGAWLLSLIGCAMVGGALRRIRSGRQGWSAVSA